eukprot:SAG11_NODE_11023_length_789_cov_1.031884_1_plen_150_part_00
MGYCTGTKFSIHGLVVLSVHNPSLSIVITLFFPVPLVRCTDGKILCCPDFTFILNYLKVLLRMRFMYRWKEKHRVPELRYESYRNSVIFVPKYHEVLLFFFLCTDGKVLCFSDFPVIPVPWYWIYNKGTAVLLFMYRWSDLVFVRYSAY